MRTHPAFHRRFSVLLLVALAALVGGCGGGGGSGGGTYAGTLEVHNSTASFEYIVDIQVDESFGPGTAYYSGVNLLPGESWFVDLTPGSYDVTLYWSDFLVQTYFIDIFAGSTTTIVATN